MTMKKDKKIEELILLVVRIRAKMNTYSWASLLPVLQKTKCQILCVHNNPLAELKKSLYLDSKLTNFKYRIILFFDSFMSNNVPIVQLEMNQHLTFLKSHPQHRNRVLFIAGGVHATALPFHCIHKLGFDVIVRGEGEKVLDEIVSVVKTHLSTNEYTDQNNIKISENSCLYNDDIIDIEELNSSNKTNTIDSSNNNNFSIVLDNTTHFNWSNVSDISYYSNGNIISNPSSSYNTRICLNDYQPYSCKLKSNSSDSGVISLFVPIEIMRGCNFACNYCQTSHLGFGQVRYRSVKTIVGIVNYYVKHFSEERNRDGIDIRFIAPNALGYGSRDGKTPNITALNDLIMSLKAISGVRIFLGTFPCEVRPDFVTPETVEILKESDSRVVALGGQSGSDSMLIKMNRKHTVTDIRNAVELLLAVNLIPKIDFILGCPNETKQEQHETLSFIQELLSDKCLVRIHHFMPLPGSAWANKQPTILSKQVLKMIHNLFQDTQVEGHFFSQLRISKIGINDEFDCNFSSRRIIPLSLKIAKKTKTGDQINTGGNIIKKNIYNNNPSRFIHRVSFYPGEENDDDNSLGDLKVTGPFLTRHQISRIVKLFSGNYYSWCLIFQAKPTLSCDQESGKMKIVCGNKICVW